MEILHFLGSKGPEISSESDIPSFAHRDISSIQTSNGARTYEPSLKILGKMVGSLYRASKYPTVPAILYLFKSQIKPKTEYCCYILAGDSQSYFSSHEKVQRSIRIFVGDELFAHR